MRSQPTALGLQPEVGGVKRVPLQENQTGSYPALKKILVAKRENDYNVDSITYARKVLSPEH